HSHKAVHRRRGRGEDRAPGAGQGVHVGRRGEKVQGHGGWAAQGQHVGNRHHQGQACPPAVSPGGVEQDHVKRVAVQGDDCRVHGWQEGAGSAGYCRWQAHAVLDPHQLACHHCHVARVRREGQVVSL
ncbi:hypothetical protein EV177_009062, partial [Coemansia sp. RSA 1804]